MKYPTQKERLKELLGRFAKPADQTLPDKEFIETVIKRWRKYLDEPVIDVGE